jgi:hypothetical protein
MNKKRLAVWFDLWVDFSWSGGKVEKMHRKISKKLSMVFATYF